MRDPDARAFRMDRGFAAAIVTATGLPTAAVLMMAPVLTALVAIFTLVIATGHAILIGVPAYLVLRRFWPLRWWNAMLGGAAVAAGPFTILILADGNPDGLAASGVFALVGAAAGFTFWWVGREQPAAN